MATRAILSGRTGAFRIAQPETNPSRSHLRISDQGGNCIDRLHISISRMLHRIRCGATKVTNSRDVIILVPFQNGGKCF
jgi:hypothetical protein